MIELVELIKYWSDRCQEHPPIRTLDWHDVCMATLAYLNCHRVTITMLRSLAGDTEDLEAEARLP